MSEGEGQPLGRHEFRQSITQPTAHARSPRDEGMSCAHLASRRLAPEGMKTGSGAAQARHIDRKWMRPFAAPPGASVCPPPFPGVHPLPGASPTFSRRRQGGLGGSYMPPAVSPARSAQSASARLRPRSLEWADGSLGTRGGAGIRLERCQSVCGRAVDLLDCPARARSCHSSQHNPMYSVLFTR